AQEKKPVLDKRLMMTAVVDLDALLNTYTSFLTQGGKDVLTNPFIQTNKTFRNSFRARKSRG
ncbi:MAG: hypothetical protein WBE75_00440, partial [Candidatus Omnitrophota bacterium]